MTARSRWLPLYAAIYIVFLYLPVALLPLFSFNDAATASFPLRGFTTRWYQALVDERTLADALVNSLIVGAASAFIAPTLGFCAARAMARYRFRGQKPAQAMI